MDRFREHGMIDPRYGAMVGYSSFSESYASKTEQLVEYGGLVRKPYKDGAFGDQIHQLLQPARISSPHDRPKKADKSSPKVIRPGSAWDNVHVGNSPSSKSHSGKYNNSSSDESDDDDDNVVCDENGYCYPKPKHANDYDTGNDYAPYGYTTNPNNYNSPKNHPSHETSYPNNYKPNTNGNDYTTPYPQPYYEKPKPNRNDYSTPPPQPYYEKPKSNKNDYSTPPPQPYYEKTKSSGNDYSTPSPQPYYEKTKSSGNDYSTPPPQPYYEKPKSNGNDYSTPSPQPYYESPNNKPMVYKPLPSVKTRLDRPNKGIQESQLENMRISSPKSPAKQRSPFASSPKSPYSSSPLKDQGYRETIDSAEARRRYGGATVGEPVEQYNGTIDSQEAARRYRGIFVKY